MNPPPTPRRRPSCANSPTHARANVLALARGLTPNYYARGVPDGHVSGLTLTVTVPGRAEPIHVGQLAMRPGVPLQATLFRLCEAAANGRPERRAPTTDVRVGLSVLTDPALHGTVADPDLRGIDPARRALLLIERTEEFLGVSTRMRDPGGLCWRPCVDEVRPLNPAVAGLFSLAVQIDRAPRRLQLGAPRHLPGRRRPEARRGSPGGSIRATRRSSMRWSATMLGAKPHGVPSGTPRRWSPTPGSSTRARSPPRSSTGSNSPRRSS